MIYEQTSIFDILDMYKDMIKEVVDPIHKEVKDLNHQINRMDDRNILTRKEAAKILGIHPNKLSILAHNKKIPYKQSCVGGSLKFYKADILEYMRLNYR